MRRGPGNRVCQAGQLAPGERVQFHRVPGGHSEGETPGPIPNPEVKPFCADGTAREASWEIRTPPEHLSKGGCPIWFTPLLVFVIVSSLTERWAETAHAQSWLIR